MPDIGDEFAKEGLRLPVMGDPGVTGWIEGRGFGIAILHHLLREGLPVFA